MPKIKTTLTDKVNGVSAIITDSGDGKPPEILLKVDNSTGCALTLPSDNAVYKRLVDLSKNLNQSGVTSGEATLSFEQISMSVGTATGGGLFASGVSSTTNRGEVSGSHADFAKPLKKQCEQPSR